MTIQLVYVIDLHQSPCCKLADLLLSVLIQRVAGDKLELVLRKVLGSTTAMKPVNEQSNEAGQVWFGLQ